MIVKEKDFAIEADKPLASSKFTIDPKNAKYIVSHLRDSLYSNKRLAVIREYSTNAQDANIDAGQPDRPIQVTIPTVVDPSFKVRDFGHGLSEEDMFGVFGSYGASTKRESNDFNGALGIGSKSAFAYAPSFSVISRHNGMKAYYDIFIDESQMGVLAKRHEAPTDEPSGLEIVVAVSESDIRNFIDESVRFYTHFSPQPEFLNFDLKSKIAEHNSGFNVVAKHDSVTCYSCPWGKSGVIVRMGNVPYPVSNLSSLQELGIPHPGNYNLLVFDVNIGDITFAASREMVEMSATTKKTLKHLYGEFVKNCGSQLFKDIEAAKTPIEAIDVYSNRDSFLQKLIPTVRMIDWHGEKIDTVFFEKLPLKKYMSQRNGWWGSRLEKKRINIKRLAFIVNDGGFLVSTLGSRRNEAQRILLSKGFADIYFIDAGVGQSKELAEKIEMKGVEVISLSSVAPVTRKSKSGKTGAGHADSQKVFKWNTQVTYPYSTSWDAVEAPKEEKVYVDIHAFAPTMTWETFRGKIEFLKSIGITVNIYGVKKDAQMDGSWVDLNDFIHREVLKITETQEFTATAVAIEMAKLARSTINTSSGLFSSVARVAPDKVKCPSFKRFTEDYRSMFTESSRHLIHESAFNFISVKGKDRRFEEICDKIDLLSGQKNDEFFKLYLEMIAQYPMLTIFSETEKSRNYYSAHLLNWDKMAKDITSYVNSMFELSQFKAGKNQKLTASF